VLLTFARGNIRVCQILKVVSVTLYWLTENLYAHFFTGTENAGVTSLNSEGGSSESHKPNCESDVNEIDSESTNKPPEMVKGNGRMFVSPSRRVRGRRAGRRIILGGAGRSLITMLLAYGTPCFKNASPKWFWLWPLPQRELFVLQKTNITAEKFRNFFTSF